MNANDMIALAQRTLAIEQEALGECAARIDAQFARAVQICLACTGRIVVTGMGKSQPRRFRHADRRRCGAGYF